MLNRRAFTLVELIVALILASIVLGTATTSVLQQQRVHARIMAFTGTDAQLRAGTGVLASQLAELDATAGDLVQGQLDDTALQFRAPIAASIACVDGIGSATLLPESVTDIPFGGAAVSLSAGDTLWWRRDTSWTGDRITDVSVSNALCASPIKQSGSSIRVTLAQRDTILAGVPLRVSRQTRYATYKSSDGSWQLGFREWSDATQHFAAPQPVAGPLLLSDGKRRSGFRYFDRTGHELAPGVASLDPTQVARIRVTAQSIVAGQWKLQDTIRVDSTDVVLGRVHDN